MCGVVGYVGSGVKPEFFYRALKRLEYRGYDSAGVGALEDNELYSVKAEGKVEKLKSQLKFLPALIKTGMAHTRWATHGKPKKANAHPHKSNKVLLLHNGIIENHVVLKAELQEKGYTFQSETDTEAAVHYLDEMYSKLKEIEDPTLRFKKAILNTVKNIKGTFSFVIICQDIPNTLFCVKSCSPLLIAVSKDGHYIASDMAPLLEYTKDFVVLNDQEIAIVKKDSFQVFDFSDRPIPKKIIQAKWTAQMMEKDGYDHFMLKEINEHSSAVSQTLSHGIDKKENVIDIKSYGLHHIDIAKIQRVSIFACGTSFYAAQVVKYTMEKICHMPVEVDLASEARYRANTVNDKVLCVALSQSGETIDTLKAMLLAKKQNAQCFSVVNVPGSSIAYQSDGSTLLHAGPEIGVASTKAFTSQIASLMLMAFGIAQEKALIDRFELAGYIKDLSLLPSLMQSVLGMSRQVKSLAKKYHKKNNILFIGRGPSFPIAQEGALKLKELSYIHAQAYAAGELKHGPIALVDKDLLSICLCPKDEYYEKTLNNIEEIRARSGKVLSIGNSDDSYLKDISTDYLSIPQAPSLIYPYLTVIHLHLFAYWCSVFRENDVDQPRNLAKSVTVE
jgi:glucosamine--fructose-6-phosphate aminotransferase (isomerizing)